MVTHKRIRLTPLDRQEIWRLWQAGHWEVASLADHFQESRPTIYKCSPSAQSGPIGVNN